MSGGRGNQKYQYSIEEIKRDLYTGNYQNFSDYCREVWGSEWKNYYNAIRRKYAVKDLMAQKSAVHKQVTEEFYDQVKEDVGKVNKKHFDLATYINELIEQWIARAKETLDYDPKDIARLARALDKSQQVQRLALGVVGKISEKHEKLDININREEIAQMDDNELEKRLRIVE